jgi:hypothetical protein
MSWTANENNLLCELVTENTYNRGTQECVSWSAVSAGLAKNGYIRSDTACRSHHKNLDDHHVISSPPPKAAAPAADNVPGQRWTAAEETFLIQAIKKKSVPAPPRECSCAPGQPHPAF